jgi:Predicted membrane protein
MAVNRSKGMMIGGVVAGILVLAFAAVSAGMLDGLFKKSPAETAKATGVAETADAVRIPLKALDSGKALLLSLESDGRQLYYFALKSRDGAYRAALDACDVCFQSNRGYRQEGDLMVCNNCGQTFPSNRIGEIKGGCNPHPLARRIEGQYLVIGKADIVAGKEYFARKRS